MKTNSFDPREELAHLLLNRQELGNLLAQDDVVDPGQTTPAIVLKSRAAGQDKRARLAERVWIEPEHVCAALKELKGLL